MAGEFEKVMAIGRYAKEGFDEGTARRKKNALAQLSSQFAGGQMPDQNFYQQVAQNDGDPQAYRKEALTRAAQHALAMEAAPEELRSQMYGQIVQEFRGAGFALPASADIYNPSYVPTLATFAKTVLGGSGASGSSVQSTYVDADGNRVGIMRDGSTQILGKNAPNNQLIWGANGLEGVNKSSLTATPVMGGGQAPPQPQQAPQGAPQSQFTLDDAALQALAQVPPQERAAALQAMLMGGDFQAIGGQAVPTPQGEQLRPAPKVANPMEQERLQIEQERLRLSQNADARAAVAANKPPAISAQERKDMLSRRAKIPQLQNTVRGMARIKTALGNLSGTLMDTGPLDAKAQKYTKAGQELDAAVGAIQNSVLSLTRVPGIGSQSDLEARIAALQYPSLDKAPEVNARTIEQLEAFVTDLATAYQVAAESDRDVATGKATAAAQPSEPATPKRLKFNPATGKLE